jgi:hypothetical protein
VKKYHAELRRAYQIIFENLQIESEIDIIKKLMFQMIVKTINNIIKLNELMLTLLVFDVYSQMHVINLSISTFNQRAITIEKAMTEVKKIKAERQVADILNARNESIVTLIHDLLLNSDVLI